MNKLFPILLFLPLMSLSQEVVLQTGDRLILKKDSISKSGFKLTKDTDGNNILYVTEPVLDEFKYNSGLFDVSKPSKALGFQLSVDQDAFYKPKNNDRDYTMGLLLSIIGHMRKERPFIKQDADEKEANRYLASFGFSGFTPINIGQTSIDTTDRPYAALAYLSYEEVYQFKPKGEWLGIAMGKSFKHGFTLGTMGKGTSSKAQFIQTAIHSGQRANAEDPSTVRPDPKGWGLAIAHDSDFPVVFNYNADFSYIFDGKLAPANCFFEPLRFGIKPTAGIAVGTLYDNISVGADCNFGFLGKDSRFGNRYSFDRSSSRKVPVRFGLSFIGDYYVQVWAHNALLNGILWQRNGDSYVIRHRDMKSVTTNWSIGAMASVGNFKLGYSVVVRSETMKKADWEQYYGRFFVKVDVN